ncbi:flagellar hook assembly protein FlgD [Sphingomonas hylomeconis]|uniref:Basal-body rod modification protein FlgD n=1 Tax=Sphingomonas hylomeconis TaxID=1395958 RepID=A0ABV7SP35_9SPHN|nr:flagellar hook capping FlgD N-terminal domain-containing protein [Sphingomonas hylomeconis]
MTLSTTSAAGSASPAAASTQSALAKLSSDTSMFLKLLTTQMQNQDPLDPMDTSAYTQQLVQFSQVEQSIQQSQSLKDILTTLKTRDLTDAASLIGRSASLDTPVAGLRDGAPASWHYATDRPAARVIATVSDADGTTVATRTLDASAGDFVWDGRDANGNRVPAGAYSLTISATDAAGSRVPATVTAQGIIDEVVVDGGTLSVVANGQRYPIALLKQLALAS